MARRSFVVGGPSPAKTKSDAYSVIQASAICARPALDAPLHRTARFRSMAAAPPISSGAARHTRCDHAGGAIQHPRPRRSRSCWAGARIRIDPRGPAPAGARRAAGRSGASSPWDGAKRSGMPSDASHHRASIRARCRGWASVGAIGLSLLLTPVWGAFLAWLAYRLAALATG